VLDSPVRVRASDLNDAGCTVDVALFEREKFGLAPDAHEQRDAASIVVHLATLELACQA
jgi:hypothetical protein